MKIGVDMEEVIRVVSDLISIPSVNPMGERVSGDEYFEREIGKYVENYLKKLKLDVVKQKVVDNRYNIIGMIDRGKNNKSILFETHMDTVPVKNMKIDPFRPFIKDNRIYGRGACDAKGSLAAMLVGIKTALNKKIKVPFIIAAVVSEEYLHIGVNKLIESGIKSFGGIVGEPTELKIAIAHKGTVRWKIITRGKSTHSSKPEQGVNAIYRMSKIINVLEKYATKVLKHKKHPVVESATLSVGKIRGGEFINIVPDYCEIEVDRRVLPGEDLFSIIPLVKKYLDSAKLDFNFEMEEPFAIDPSMELSKKEIIVDRVKNAVERVCVRASIIGVSYGSDASKLTSSGIPTLVFGPGNISQAHSSEEYVDIESLLKASMVYKNIIL